MVEIVKQQISTEAPGGHSRRASVGSHPGNKDDELSGPLTVDDDGEYLSAITFQGCAVKLISSLGCCSSPTGH